MLNIGADPSVLSQDGYAPLHEAATHPSLTKLLLSRGADVKGHSPTVGITPLHVAARLGSPEVCQLLLDAGANINACTQVGTAPLHEAAEHGKLDVIDLLISAGATIGMEDSEGDTPLQMAVASPYMDDDKRVTTVTALLKHGAGDRPAGPWHELDQAAWSGPLAVVELLLEQGAVATCTTVAHAAEAGNLAIVKLLIASGVDANDESLDFTPLHCAAGSGHTDVCVYLIKHGASPTGKSTHGTLGCCSSLSGICADTGLMLVISSA